MRKARFLPKLAKKLGLKHRYLPAEGYELNKNKTSFVKKELIEETSLESKVAASIISLLFLASIFFSSSSLTGNAIANLTNQTSSLIGGVLFIVGIVGGWMWFKRR